MSRTRLAPTPTNISTKSEPLMLKKAASASPAMALANSVLPVPGAPTIRMPLGILPPSFWNFFGSLRNSTSSETSSQASSTPATSLKVILFFSLLSIRALLLPKFIAPRPALRICRISTNQISRKISRIGSRFTRNPISRVFLSRDWNPRISFRNFSCASSSLSSNENGIFLLASTRYPVMVHITEALGGGCSM